MVSPPRPGSRTILLVEDDDIVRRLLRRVLEREGHEVVDAGDAPAALRELRDFEGRIDLLLTDVVLPGGMNGVELALMAPALRPEIKTLCMSGYGEDVSVDRNAIPDPAVFIQKPFTPKALAETVHELLAEPEQEWVPERSD